MRKLKEKLFLKEYDEEKIKIANKTARASGASALNKDGSIRSVVGRYVLDNVSKDASILDFGSGPAAVQTLALRDAGFKNVSAYDFGVNTRDGIQDPDALNKKYDVVFASNVLNVSSDEEMLRETLRDIKKAAKNEIVFNYPSSPRKSGLNAQEVRDIIIDEYGVEPELVSGTKSVPVWKVLLNNSKTISEDTVKTRDGKWINRGDSGETHGEFRTKKQADAQRKAIYASGWKKESVEDLADRVRKNDLEWNDEIEASYAEDGDVAVEFQDRETFTHEVTPYRSRRPRVSSNTWGRIWKDGDLVYNERGPKYKVRDDIIKKLNSMNESFESNLERKLVRMWFNEDQAAWLVKHDPETAEWLAYGNIRTQDLIDVEQEINQKMGLREDWVSVEEDPWLNYLWSVCNDIDNLQDIDYSADNCKYIIFTFGNSGDLESRVDSLIDAFEAADLEGNIIKTNGSNVVVVHFFNEYTNHLIKEKSLKEGQSIKDTDKEILKLLEHTSLSTYISRYYEFETTKSGLQRLLNIYAPDDMDSFEFNSIRREVNLVLGSRDISWNSDDGLIIVDVTSFYKESDVNKEEYTENLDKDAIFTKDRYDDRIYYHGFMDKKDADKHYPDRLKTRTYWYSTRHGVMPGSVPRGINILDVRDIDNKSYFKTDSIISSEDLAYYDIKEDIPPMEESKQLSKKHGKLLKENAYIKTFKLGDPEFENLYKLADILTKKSPNKYVYYVGDTYFDLGQNWMWTTVLCRGDWSSYQALNPREREEAILANSDAELEKIADSVLSDKYCPDKKRISEDAIADKIKANQNTKEMTRRAIQILKKKGAEYKDLEKEYEKIYGDKLIFDEK